MFVRDIWAFNCGMNFTWLIVDTLVLWRPGQAIIAAFFLIVSVIVLVAAKMAK